MRISFRDDSKAEAQEDSFYNAEERLCIDDWLEDIFTARSKRGLDPKL